jgi:predicted PurR-regulated permease PerM
MSLDLSINTIFKVLAVLAGLWFVFIIRDVIAIMFTAIIVTSALSPTIDQMARYRIPRVVTILLVYLLLIAFIGVLVYFILPPAVTQMRQLAEQLPSYFAYFQKLVSNLQTFGVQNHLISGSQAGINTVSDFLNNFTSNIFNTTKGFISSFTAILTVFVLTLYLLLDENGIKNFFVALLPVKQKNQIVTVANKVGAGLGAWLRGQILLGIIVGVMVYVGLLIIGVPYALTLGLLAGVLEIIPIIGPIISAIPAILIALSISPTLALIVTGFYLLVQELENKLLVPKVMQRTVGLHPVTIIIVLLIGAKIMGVLGILLAVPVASVVYIILKEWSHLSNRPSRSK